MALDLGGIRKATRRVSKFARRNPMSPGSGDVTVGPRAALLRDECRVGHVSWQQPRPPLPSGVVGVQLRHHHPAEAARLLPDTEGDDGGGVRVRFERPSGAVTPGQYAAFYDGDLVLGGGRIRRPAPAG